LKTFNLERFFCFIFSNWNKLRNLIHAYDLEFFVFFSVFVSAAAAAAAAVVTGVPVMMVATAC
jgi:hypothetical protein